MATEIRRQTLLREMGVQSWFPRTALPGAGPSHVVVHEPVQPTPTSVLLESARPESARLESARPVGVQSESARPEHAQAETGDRIPAALRATLTPGPVQAPSGTQTVEPTDTGPCVADGPALEFAFSWFNIDKRLAVLSMLPAGADSLHGDGRQMLQRILAALSPELGDAIGHEHTFHWPFPGDLGLPGGQRAARQAVDGFVARRLREQPSAMLLILADDTPPFLYGDTVSGGEDLNGPLVVHRQFGFAMLRTHSLHAMAANTALKRSAWQAMQSLRDRLNRGAD